MAPIYIPPQPVPVIRQRIRNQADIQDQLRAYDKQQQAIINANDVRFDENNLGRKIAMYPEPSLTTGFKPLFETDSPAEPETKSAEEPTPALMQGNPLFEVVREPDPVVTKQLIDLDSDVPETPLRIAKRSQRQVARPLMKEKSLVELREDIRATGFAGAGLSKAKRPVLENLAKNLGLSIMRSQPA